MQTGIKDGKVTLIMSCEEWLVMSNIIVAGVTKITGGNQDAAACIADEIMKLDVEFNAVASKELEKIPQYLKTLIGEAYTENPDKVVIFPLKKGGK